MRNWSVPVFDPDEYLATVSESGMVTIWRVGANGQVVEASVTLPKAPTKAEAYMAPIDDLQLSTRAYNVLKREGLHTAGSMVAQFKVRDGDALREVRGMTDECFEEIKGHVRRIEELR